MGRKSTTRPARERSDVSTAAPLAGNPVGSFAKTAEISGIATAMSVAAFGVLQANEAYARGFSENPMPVKFPLATADAVPHVSMPTHDTAQPNPAHQVATPQAAIDLAGSANAPSQQVQHASAATDQSHLTTDAPATGQAIAEGQMLVEHVAQQMTAGISSVLDLAAKGEMTPDHIQGHLQGLAQSIVHTATGIVEDIRAQIGFDTGHAAIGTVLQDTASIAGNIAGGIVSDVENSLDCAGITNLLHGDLGVLPAEAMAPIGGIVADLTGEIGPVLAGVSYQADQVLDTVSHAVDTAIAIPAELLGGNDASAGPLTELFYDDGGAGGLSHIAQATAPVLEVPEIGFAGQPLSVSDEVSGLLHGANALHLV